MHDCPNCGSACYCDMEDHEQPAPANCRHECDPTDAIDDRDDCDFDCHEND
jgi:hypothetical protein